MNRQIHFQKIIASVALAEGAVVKNGLLGSIGALAHHVRLVLLFVAQKVVGEGGFGCGRGVLHHSPVGLAYLVMFYLLVEARQGFARLGENHQPAHGPVQSVHHAAEHVARLVVFLFQVIFDKVGHAEVARFVALHYLRRQFIDDYQMVVFVNNLTFGEIRTHGYLRKATVEMPFFTADSIFTLTSASRGMKRSTREPNLMNPSS